MAPEKIDFKKTLKHLYVPPAGDFSLVDVPEMQFILVNGIARLHNEFIPATGLVENGDHHEIYLGDPRKTVPEKLKTILRQSVKRN